MSSVLPMFSSKNFIVSGLIFSSLIHFVCFCVWCQKCSNFTLLHVVVQFSQHHLLKRLSFSPLYIFAPLSKVSKGVWIYLWTSCLVPMAYISIFVCGVRECSSFMLLQVINQSSQHHLLKRLSFLHCISLPPLSKIRCSYVHKFISVLSILFY